MSGRILAASATSIALAAKRLRAGELVAFPTETVYGLGADAGNADAVHRIFVAKGRPSDHPVIVHLANVADVERWAREFPEGARRLAAAFWPGPLTLIVPRSPHVGDAVTGGQDNVGLRMPSHPVARQLLAAFAGLGGSGIAAPSANRFGHVSPTAAQHVADDLGDAVAMILDGGACDVGIESTIIAFTGREPVLLRPGGIAVEDVVRVLGTTPRAPDAGAPRAPEPWRRTTRHTRRYVSWLLTTCCRPRDTPCGDRVAVLARTVIQPRTSPVRDRSTTRRTTLRPRSVRKLARATRPASRRS
jgi:L-threonylcarbamoyladenylate synthase